MKISKDYLKKPPRDPHLHSPAHVLADELANKLGDQSHFGFYLKMALTQDHNVLRKIAGEVVEGKSKNPGALFAYLLKKFNRENPVSHGYSIWLLPEPMQRQKLAQAIASLAAAYDSVPLDPHITLLGNLPEAHESSLKALAQLPEFSVELGLIKTEEAFFKSFYLPVAKNKQMLAARRLAKNAFNFKPVEKFQPHLSVLYGNFPPERKLEMLRNVTVDFPRQLKLTHAALVKTEGTIGEWQSVKQLNLQPSE